MAQTDPRKRALGGGAATSTSAQAQPAAAPQQPQKAQAPAQPPATPQAAQQQTPGTGFVNLQRVLQANRAGSQQLGQQLGQRVQQQGQQAQQAIQAGQGAYTAALAAKADAYRYNPAADATLNQSITDDMRGDARLTLLQQQNNRALELADRDFVAPKDWDAAGVDTAALSKQAIAAEDSAKALGTAGGRAALLRETNPNLTAGGASLDAFLAGAGMGNAAQESVASFGSLSDMLKAGREAGQAGYKQAVTESEATDKQYVDLANKLKLDHIAEQERQRRLSLSRTDAARNRRRSPKGDDVEFTG